MGTVKRFESPAQLFEEAAEFILSLAEKSGKRFLIALAGGSTPRGLYQRMTQEDFSGRFPWSKAHFFWGDERWVPASDSRSNYKMAKETLLDPAGVAPSNIHPVNTALPSPEASAADYEKTLKGPGPFLQKGARPLFDLVLLGLGEDGHTASLFPGDPALKEKKRLVAAAKLNTPEPRITLTLPAINHAKCVLFLVSGESKKKIFAEVVSKSPHADYPAAKINPASGNLFWFFSPGPISAGPLRSDRPG